MGKRINQAIWLEKHNRWQIKVQKDGVRKTFTLAVRWRAGMRECHKKADAFLDENIDDSIKAGKLLSAWLTELQSTTSTGNYSNIKGIINNWLLPAIEYKKMNSLSEQDFQNILIKAYSDGKAQKTINNIRACILQFTKYARKCNAFSLHLENLYIPKNSLKKEKEILQLEDLKILFSVDTREVKGKMQKEWYINAFRFFVVTGLRRGELVALQLKRDYDADTNMLYIRESVNKYNELTKGKNANAVRNFYLYDIAQKIITEQQKMLKESGLISMYLFPAKSGEISNSNRIYKEWVKYASSNLKKPISLHELRHTFISMCKTVPKELLKQQIGHSEVMDTFGQYGHEIQGEKQLTAELINNEIAKWVK